MADVARPLSGRCGGGGCGGFRSVAFLDLLFSFGGGGRSRGGVRLRKHTDLFRASLSFFSLSRGLPGPAASRTTGRSLFSLEAALDTKDREEP